MRKTAGHIERYTTKTGAVRYRASLKSTSPTGRKSRRNTRHKRVGAPGAFFCNITQHAFSKICRPAFPDLARAYPKAQHRESRLQSRRTLGAEPLSLAEKPA